MNLLDLAMIILVMLPIGIILWVGALLVIKVYKDVDK